MYYPHTQAMYNQFTGVDRAYRGQRIGLALKLLAIRCARQHNVAYLWTHNDSKNAHMLAINQKLGYEPRPGKYRMSRNLGAMTH